MALAMMNPNDANHFSIRCNSLVAVAPFFHYLASFEQCISHPLVISPKQSRPYLQGRCQELECFLIVDPSVMNDSDLGQYICNFVTFLSLVTPEYSKCLGEQFQGSIIRFLAGEDRSQMCQHSSIAYCVLLAIFIVNHQRPLEEFLRLGKQLLCRVNFPDFCTGFRHLFLAFVVLVLQPEALDKRFHGLVEFSFSGIDFSKAEEHRCYA
mmetsp:Transcript_5202/g.11627  ORF Transcript_5202/g.11627 Transcript_5202/m.11627 type:complete len:209 (-) Transcript_5202:100-726(-)